MDLFETAPVAHLCGGDIALQLRQLVRLQRMQLGLGPIFASRRWRRLGGD
jgi:hypothetical protein